MKSCFFLAIFVPFSAFAQPPLVVELIQVNITKSRFDLALTGTIEAQETIDMGFRQGGRVTEVRVNAGDPIIKGQELARTDPSQQQQALGVAQAALSAALASHHQAKQAFDRATAMLDRGVGTRAVNETVLRASADGVVTRRDVDPGQIVSPAQTVMSMAVNSGLEAVFLAPDSGLLNRAMGADVTLGPIDFQAPDMAGVVTEISPMVDPETGSVTVRAHIEGEPIKAGFLGAAVYGQIDLPTEDVMTIPWTALTESQGQPAVWRVTDGIANLTPVVIGRFQTKSVIIESGLEPGQIVVGQGSQMLYPGRAVTDIGGAQ